jgi:nucleotide-binding universal stress UspA family protein
MSLNPTYRAAIEDFHRLRRRAGLQKIFNRFRKDHRLLSYEDIRHQLRAVEKSGTRLETIPLEAIQGSVGRYEDFTRDFLPKGSIDPQRWARVKTQFHSLEGIPPIEVYKIGEVYFVSDGNHRVSVARQMGNTTIEAYVRELVTKVPLEIDEDLDQLLIKAEYAEFLAQTQFNQLYPTVDLLVTAPGRYTIILQQIEAIRFARELNGDEPVTDSEAIKYWHNTIYDPIIETIREQNILKDYPGRTETDLFLWIYKHRALLAQTLGWDISPESAAKNLLESTPSTFSRIFEQSSQLFNRYIRHQELDVGPPPGTWRKQKMASPEGRLFGNIIAVIDGSEMGWEAFSHGIMISGLEGSQIYGLCVTPPQQPFSEKKRQAIVDEFAHRCESCDARGQLAFAEGAQDQIIKNRAYWADLVVLYFENITPEIQSLVQNCPAPLLVVKTRIEGFNSILLAYDGSPKSEEALFLAAYLATFWELSLSVITILESEHKQVTQGTILKAKEFLDYYGISAHFQEIEDDPVERILKSAQAFHSELIVLGGYGAHTISKTRTRVLDDVLQKSKQSVLICR